MGGKVNSQSAAVLKQATGAANVGTYENSTLEDSLKNRLKKIDSFPSLRLFQGYPGQSVNLLAHTYNGKGGGLFRWFAGDKADDGGKIARYDATGYWMRVGYTKTTPYMYGAAGDGVTNDTTPFVNMCAALVDGDEVRVKGKFNIHGSLVKVMNVPNVTFDLRGAVFNQKTTFSKTLYFEACHNLKIKSGVFNGLGGASGEYNGASSSYNGVAALFLKSCNYPEIEGVQCFNHAGGDIQLRDSDNTTITRCYLQGIGSAYINPVDNGSDFGISSYAVDDIRIGEYGYVHNWSGNRITEHAFGVQCTATKSFKFHRNVVDRIWGQHGIYGIENDGMDIQGNMFRDCYQQAIKMQHENYAGTYISIAWVTATPYTVGALVRINTNLYECIVAHTSGTFATDLAANKWQLSSLMIRNGGIIANNEFVRCGTMVGIITQTVANGKEEYIKGLSVFNNKGRSILQDGFKFDRCIDLDFYNNRVTGAGRYGAQFIDCSGLAKGNYFRDTVLNGMTGNFSDNMQILDNTMLDCALSGTTQYAYPVYFSDVTANGIPSFAAKTPTINFDDNKILFTTGDAASGQLTYFDARYKVGVKGTRTNSALTFRVNGTLLYNFKNEFKSFDNVNQNGVLAYSASISINATLGDFVEFTALNNTPFTINTPTGGYLHQRITVRIKNGAGGALGTVTWGSGYKVPTLTYPANGFSRGYDFIWNGANWIYSGSSGLDVPN